MGLEAPSVKSVEVGSDWGGLQWGGRGLAAESGLSPVACGFVSSIRHSGRVRVGCCRGVGYGSGQGAAESCEPTGSAPWS